jgi:hypothetical protein
MTDTIGFPEAARTLGVPLRILRRAIRAGKIPAPPSVSAVANLPADWFRNVQATVDASPNVFSRASFQKVPAFARYPGTSAWRKYTNRVREYAHFQASQTAGEQAS